MGAGRGDHARAGTGRVVKNLFEALERHHPPGYRGRSSLTALHRQHIARQASHLLRFT